MQLAENLVIWAEVALLLLLQLEWPYPASGALGFHLPGLEQSSVSLMSEIKPSAGVKLFLLLVRSELPMALIV